MDAFGRRLRIARARGMLRAMRARSDTAAEGHLRARRGQRPGATQPEHLYAGDARVGRHFEGTYFF